MSIPVITCRDVHKKFNGKTVLNSLNLSVLKGSVVGLLGRNGAGKTTLIKLMLGLLKANNGETEIFGEDSWGLSDRAKERIGYVPQSERLYPWLSVQQLIDYTASFYLHWNQDLVAHLKKEWRIDSRARMGNLSEGEAQKVAILLALGHEPELLILDEPVATLDPLSRRQFLKMLLELVSDHKCTIFFSTHITFDLERVADHVAILNDGAIRFYGNLEELKETVKRLRILGSAPQPEDMAAAGIIYYEKTDTGAIVSVKDFRDDLPESLSRQFNIDVRVEDLNLEEIFLEMSR